MSLSADCVAYAALVPKDTNYAASVPKGTNKVPSREAGTEALCSANSLRRNAKNKAPLRAKGKVTTTSLSNSSGAKFALRGGATSIASPSEANTTDEVIFKSPVVKNRSCNARVLQPELPSTRSPRLSVQDRVSFVNTDLREFLTNKRKLELLQTSPSCCEQVGCQLVMVHY